VQQRWTGLEQWKEVGQKEKVSANVSDQEDAKMCQGYSEHHQPGPLDLESLPRNFDVDLGFFLNLDQLGRNFDMDLNQPLRDSSPGQLA
jgi:hypothetical protein